MGSKDKAIKQKYGVLGYCEKNGESHVILNTIDNVIKCSSCRYFRPVETSGMKMNKFHTSHKYVCTQNLKRRGFYKLESLYNTGNMMFQTPNPVSLPCMHARLRKKQPGKNRQW